MKIRKIHQDGKLVRSATREVDSIPLSTLNLMMLFARLHYDPNRFGCREVCESLASFAEGWEVRSVPVLVNKGKIEAGCSHYVLAGGPMIIDPTADQFDCSSLKELRNNLTPWIFMCFGKNRYCSLNRMPYSPLELSDVPEQCIVAVSGEPEYSSCKFIFTD